MILLIDNYDGCANNLYQLAGVINPDIRIVRNDKITVSRIKALSPSHIIISGGSASPEKAGCDMDVIKTFAGSIPLLGVCLGYRLICAAYGGESIQMQQIAQGTREQVQIDRSCPLFKGLPETFFGGFYHSKTVPEKNIPEAFNIIARCGNDVAGVAHKTAPLYGLQFHPESFLSEYGHEIMANFLSL